MDVVYRFDTVQLIRFYVHSAGCIIWIPSLPIQTDVAAATKAAEHILKPGKLRAKYSNNR